MGLEEMEESEYLKVLVWHKCIGLGEKLMSSIANTSFKYSVIWVVV